MLGEDAVVVGCEGSCRDTSSPSLSRTWRMTSASRLASASTGAPSSCSKALMREKFFDFG